MGKTFSKDAKEGIKLRETVILKKKDKFGRVVEIRELVGEVGDLITNAGKASVAGLILVDITEPAYDYIAIGTGTTSPAATDTALVAETHREAGTGTLVTTTVTNDTARLVATFQGYAGSEAVTEVGMFNAATGGDMLMRRTFSPLNMDWAGGDSLEISVQIQVQ